ncbi:aldo/keto reductase [Williamsia serinedens]|uniref:Aldo/keto reductase n=1 Tax=Williamsia serinedens TaxID=391736 RepID=A0ABT1GZ25_9NOCA|nr:aldo/keto reductase [Williamsia serinedens]MCP2160196.1 Aldo/keto reductase [Williamsia serinedens]
MSALAIPTAPLTDAPPIPLVGLGTYKLLGRPGAEAVATAIRSGYRLVDTATRYSNERSVGIGIAESGVARDDVTVITKLGGGDHGFDPTVTAARQSARRLGVDRIDVFLIHWPCPSLGLTLETWRAMLALVDDGVVRAAGVSNFTVDQLQMLFDETGRWPVLNQIQCSPALPRQELRAFMAQNGIHAQAWSPTGRTEGVLDDDRVTAIAEAHGRSPIQVALRWSVQQGIGVIPKSADPDRQVHNASLFDWELRDDDMASLAGLDLGESAARDSHVDEEF